jgi:hypothetical protein
VLPFVLPFLTRGLRAFSVRIASRAIARHYFSRRGTSLYQMASRLLVPAALAVPSG